MMAGIGGIFGSGGSPGAGNNYWYSEYGAGESASGVNVTADIALKASALYACAKVLAETIATLPYQMFKQGADGGLMPATSHPLDDIIRFQPNNRQTAVEFWETMVLNAGIHGAAYAEIVPGKRGFVDQLRPIHPDYVKAELMDDDNLRFEVRNPKNGSRRIILHEEMFRIYGWSSDGVTPMRMVDYAANAIGLGLSQDMYASRLFKNNLNFGVILEHPGKLSPEAQQNMIDAYMRRLAGASNAHRPMVLQEGLKATKITQNATEAQLLEARKWQVGEIARFLRIPLHMLGIDDQTNRSTVEEQSINFVKYTIRPWCRRIEQATRRDLIIAAQYEAKFNLDGLQRGNLQARSEYFFRALGGGGNSPGWLTPNEVREIEGYNRHKDGDKLPMPIAKPTGPAALIEDKTIQGRAGKLARRENAAFKRASLRLADDPDALKTWIRSYYGGHVSCVMEILGVSKEAARAYCDYQRDEAILFKDTPDLIARRENDLANQISSAILNADGVFGKLDDTETGTGDDHG